MHLAAHAAGDSGVATTLGQAIHFAVTWHDTGIGTSEVNYWRDGMKMTDAGAVTSNLADLNDVNTWLGRSTWLGDGNLNGTFDEFRIYDTALAEAEITASRLSGPDAVLSDDDSDSDGIPDAYEDLFAFLDPNDGGDAGEDEDLDNLSNLEEYQQGTTPDDDDTDDDGLSDGDEVKIHGSNPLFADTDGDGLDDGDEVTVHSTLPNDPDSDDDLIPDGYETQFAFLDPNVPGDAANDQEPDGLSNLAEFQAGTEPDNDDTDSDDVSDGDEVNTYGTSPLDADTDDDGLTDGQEINTTMTQPLVADSDDDGINDGPEFAANLDPNDAGATSPGIVHRYMFDAAAGGAGVGTTVLDSIGGADGIIVGSGGVWTGTALSLPGGTGADADAAYVDLPNGILSAHDHVTFEAWYTMHSLNNWSRIWDFGSTDGGEVTTGITGATQGQDYFIFAPNRGTDINVQRFTVRNLDPLAGGGGSGPVDEDEEAHDTSLASNLSQQYHVAGVWTSDGQDGGQLILYRDGVYEGSRTTTFTPRDINDVNNWLGRSNWTGDNYFNGDFNEFRIYEGAMNEAAAAASFTAGPDAAIGSGDFRITQIIHDTENNTFTISFTSRPNTTYKLNWSTDLKDFEEGEILDDIPSGGETTIYGPFDNPSPGAPRIYFQIAE